MIDVSCAIIVNAKNEILITQRSASMKLPLKWEFPGGKIEKGETAENCLIREIKEELGVEIVIKKSFPSVKHDYEEFSVCLIPFVCEIRTGEIKLSEHANYRWLAQNELLHLDWAEADIPVAKNFLIQIHSI